LTEVDEKLSTDGAAAAERTLSPHDSSLSSFFLVFLLPV